MPNMPNKVTARVRGQRKNSCQPFDFLIECLLKTHFLPTLAPFSLHCFFSSLSLSPGLISSSRRVGYLRRIRRIGFRMRNLPASFFFPSRKTLRKFLFFLSRRKAESYVLTNETLPVVHQTSLSPLRCDTSRFLPSFVASLSFS